MRSTFTTCPNFRDHLCYGRSATASGDYDQFRFKRAQNEPQVMVQTHGFPAAIVLCAFLMKPLLALKAFDQGR